MDVTSSEDVLIIVQGLFDEKLDYDKFSLEINEDRNDMIEGYDSSVSVNEEYGLVARGDTQEEAIELYNEVRDILQEDYPSVDFPEPTLVNAIVRFHLSVGEDDDLSEFNEYLGRLEGVDIEKTSLKKRRDTDDLFHVEIGASELSDDGTHRLRLHGFNGDIEGPALEYIREYIEEF